MDKHLKLSDYNFNFFFGLQDESGQIIPMDSRFGEFRLSQARVGFAEGGRWKTQYEDIPIREVDENLREYQAYQWTQYYRGMNGVYLPQESQLLELFGTRLDI